VVVSIVKTELCTIELQTVQVSDTTEVQ
jgi:hypothetical protein